MKRVGYDADTQKYSFVDQSGNYWEGPEGQEYGELTRGKHNSLHSLIPSRRLIQLLLHEIAVGEARIIDSDLEASASPGPNGYQPLNSDDVSCGTDAYLNEPLTLCKAQAAYTRNKEAWRRLLPFFLIICVVLLLVFRLIQPSALKPSPTTCPEHNRPYEVKLGDTCWAIARDYGTSVDNLRTANPSLECSALMPGQHICVPVAD